MTAEKLDLTRRAKDGREIRFLEWRGRGSLSERYSVEIDGARYFMKTYLHTDSCSGAGSRNIIKNEMYTYSAMEKQPLLYRGQIEIDDVCGLLFEDMMTAGREGQSLAELMFKANAPLPVTKEEVKATNLLSLENAVHVIAEVAGQAHDYSTAYNLVHTDITPENILLVNDFEGDQIKRRAILSDFGLARRINSSSKNLFNQANVKGIASTYYGSSQGIFHNRIYSPPNIDSDYQNMEVSYDTYNLANILCLLLTGRLAEFWKKDPGASDPAVGSKKIIEQQISSHYYSAVPDAKIMENLAEIISKGTHDSKDQRYQTAAELQQALLDLKLPVPVSYQPEHRLNLSIPDHIANYKISEPPLQEVYGPELQKMQGTLDKIIGESKPLLQAREHVLEVSVENQLVKAWKDNQQSASRLRRTWKYVAIGLGLAAALAGGIYLSGNYPSLMQRLPKNYSDSASSTDTERVLPGNQAENQTPETPSR